MEYIKSWFLSLLTALGLIQPTITMDSNSLKIGDTCITIVQGDITKQNIDVIVNAANEELQHGGGVAKAISKAAGPQLQEYCNTLPDQPFVEYKKPGSYKCPTGWAVITPSFDLEKVGIKKIIHTTGPRGSNPDKENLLRKSYQNSLQVASNNKLKSIAFPAISTAVFGYDIEKATPIAFSAVRDFIKQHPNMFDEIRFVVFSDKDLGIYKQYMNILMQ